MTFKEKFAIPKDATHIEKYTTIVNGLGFENVKHCLPYTKQEIAAAYKKDKHLNNLSINSWDRAVGFSPFVNPRTQIQNYLIHRDTAFIKLCYSHNVTCFSVAECVCILKRCAVMWITNDITNETTERINNNA